MLLVFFSPIPSPPPSTLYVFEDKLLGQCDSSDLLQPDSEVLQCSSTSSQLLRCDSRGPVMRSGIETKLNEAPDS